LNKKKKRRLRRKENKRIGNSKKYAKEKKT